MTLYSRSRGIRSRRTPAALDAAAGMCEPLESRLHLDAVFWDGGAGTSNWHDAANWNRNGVDALPQDGDDVIINVAANPTIIFSSGSVTLASLMTNEALTITGGTLGLTGTADINATLTVNGGTIQGGTWDVTGGTLTAGANTNSTFNGVTVSGDLILGAGARARIQNSITFTGAANRIRFTGSGGQQLGFVGGGSLLTGGISFEATSGTSDVGVVGSGTLTIGAGVQVTGGRGRVGQNIFGAANTGVTIEGSILANVPSTTITLTTGGSGVLTIAATGSVGAMGNGATIAVNPNAAAWSSAGSISAAAGGVVTLNGAWSSTGSFIVNGGTLNLGGSFSYSSIAAGFSRTGGTVNITGAMNNEGQTVTLTAATGDWVLNGGSIVGGAAGGSIRLDGGSLLYAPNSANTLDRQRFVTGDLALMNNASLRIVNGIQFASPSTQRIRLGGSGASNLGFVGDSVIPVNVVFESTAGTDDIGPVGTGTLTIAPGVTISGGRGRMGQSQFTSGHASIINQGTILANAPGQSIVVTTSGAGVFTNAATGVLRATGAGATLTVDVNSGPWSSAGTIRVESGAIVSLNDAWSSTGTIAVDGGTLNLGGSFNYSSIATGFSRSGGTVNITGTLNNENQTVILNAATGDWVLSGGTISGGSAGGFIAQDGAGLLYTSNNSSTLDRQTLLSGDLILGTGQSLRIANGISFAALGGQRIRMAGAGNNHLGFVGDFTIPVDVSFEATASVSEIGNVGDGVLTIPEGVTVSGGRGVIGILQFMNGSTGVVNNGAVVANVAGTTLTLDASNSGSVRNSGSLSATNGATLTVNDLAGDLAGVNVSGAGSAVNLNGSFTLRGILAPVTGTTISINVAAPAVAWSAGAGGGFNVQGGTLNLGGRFSAASVANFLRAGGNVNIVGTLNNEGQILTLNNSTGSWNLNGGTISGGNNGGRLRFLDGASLTFSSNAANTLDRQTSEGDIVLGSGASLRIVNGFTFTSSSLRFRLVGTGGNRLGFVGDTTLETGGISFENTSGISDAGPVGNATLTIAPGVVVSGGRARFGLTQFGAGNGNVVNQSLILANVAGQTLTVQASGSGVIRNDGQLSASSGATLAVSDLVGQFNNAFAGGAGSVVTLAGTFTVTGQLIASSGGMISVNPGSQTAAWSLDSVGSFDVQGGTLNLGGRFTLASDAKHRRNGGSVNITGILDNQGQTLTLDANTGSWNLGGGVIDGGAIGGTLRFTQGATLSFNNNNANTLMRQSIDGDLVVGTNGMLRIAGGITFLGANDRLRLAGNGGNIVAFVGDTTLSTGGIVFQALAGLSDVGLVGSGTLTIGEGVTVSGGRGRLGLSHFMPGTTSVINNGVIEGNLAGQNLTIDTAGSNPGAFTNTAVVRASGGGRVTVSADTPVSNIAAGALSGGTWIASGDSVINLTPVITTNNATIGVGGVNSFPAVATLRTNNGVLQAVGGGTFTITPAGGTLMNNGVLSIAPGNTVNVMGNFTQASFGTMQVEFSGAGEDEIGQLVVSGTAALGGSLTSTPTLEIDHPCMNSRFLSAAAVTGQFASQILFTPAGRFQSYTLLSGGEMRLVIQSFADYNRDGVLNTQDFIDFFEDFFNNDADYNADGTTDTQDFFDFIKDFFTGCP